MNAKLLVFVGAVLAAAAAAPTDISTEEIVPQNEELQTSTSTSGSENGRPLRNKPSSENGQACCGRRCDSTRCTSSELKHANKVVKLKCKPGKIIESWSITSQHGHVDKLQAKCNDGQWLRGCGFEGMHGSVDYKLDTQRIEVRQSLHWVGGTVHKLGKAGSGNQGYLETLDCGKGNKISGYKIKTMNHSGNHCDGVRGVLDLECSGLKQGEWVRLGTTEQAQAAARLKNQQAKRKDLRFYNGQVIALKASNGKYCSDVAYAGKILCGNDKVMGWEKFTVRSWNYRPSSRGGSVFLKGGSRNQYCGDTHGNDLSCTTGTLPNKHTVTHGHIHMNPKWLSAWERLEWKPEANGPDNARKVSLVGGKNKKYCALSAKDGRVICNSAKKSQRAIFTVECIENCQHWK